MYMYGNFAFIVTFVAVQMRLEDSQQLHASPET